MSLLDDLNAEKSAAVKGPPCALCDLIRAEPDIHTRAALTDAAAGSLGVRALTRVLQKNQTGIGMRTVRRHRSEEHTP